MQLPVTTLKTGSIEKHTAGSTANGNATMTGTGQEFTAKTSIGDCIWTTNNTDLGTIWGGTPAVRDGTYVAPRTGGEAGFLCGSSVTVNGKWTITTPSTLLID